jgi:hypothetical protein
MSTMPNDIQHYLPEIDIEFLRDKGFDFEEYQVVGEVHLIIHNFQLPPAYRPGTCDLLLKLPAGFPNANPDMFWTSPTVQLLNGNCPMSANVMEVCNGRTWQRWSRHSASWRPGVDSLRSKLRSVQVELELGR